LIIFRPECSGLAHLGSDCAIRAGFDTAKASIDRLSAIKEINLPNFKKPI
jgi:hypothetical protein